MSWPASALAGHRYETMTARFHQMASFQRSLQFCPPASLWLTMRASIGFVWMQECGQSELCATQRRVSTDIDCGILLLSLHRPPSEQCFFNLPCDGLPR